MASLSDTRGISSILLGAALLMTGFAPGAGSAQTPRRGDVQRLPVITVALQVGSTEKDARHVTYTPPPGWYVRSHAVECAKKYGNASFAVATVPQNWGWLSEEKVAESYKALVEMAARAKDVGAQARFTHDREATLAELRKARSTHHALVVDVTARGEGWLRGGGGIELVVTAELVYVGTDDDLAGTVERHRAELR